MFAPLRRMRAKGPGLRPQQLQPTVDALAPPPRGPDSDPPQASQQPLENMPSTSACEEAPSAKRQVYFLTFPHPHAEFGQDGVALVAPDSLSRQELLQRVLGACASPEYVHRWSGDAAPSSVVVSMAAVFRELHVATNGGVQHCHYHVALKADASFRFAPVKKALLMRFGLASHWSCTHAGYWSPIKYCSVPSPTKPAASLDPKPLLWARQGVHPPLHLCCHEPATAAAMTAKRQRREQSAAEKGKTEPRITEFELWPIVVESGIRNEVGVRNAHLLFMDYVKEKCSSSVCSFVFRNRARLPNLIDDIWRWEGIKGAVAVSKQTRMDMVQGALQKACVCGGAWLTFALHILHRNGINPSELGQVLVRALDGGRSPTTPVVTFAGSFGGEGKSFILKGLLAVFGADEVFYTPQHQSFPFLGLENAKVVFLDDFRFFKSAVPVATQCLWFDGSALPVAKPQNQPGCSGHDIYRGTAPIFITTKMQDIEALERVGDGDASMILRRLKVFHFRERVASNVGCIPECAHCFARLIGAQQP